MATDLLPRLRWYLFAAALTVATVAVVRAVDAATDVPLGLEPFMLPIALSGFFGGLGAGFVAIVLSAGAAAVGFPGDPLTAGGAVEWAGMLVGGGLVVGLLHRARTASFLAASREARFATIAATAMDGIITLDEAHRVTSFNEAAERMFGMPAAKILGQPLDPLLPEGFAQRHAQHLAAFAGSGVTRRALGGDGVLGRRATGELFPIELSISQALVDGKPVFTGILRDLTSRVQAEKTLRETASQLRLFIENAPAAVAMFDREMRYLLASRRWIADYRLVWSDVVGRSHYEIFPEISETWREIHRRSLEGAVERCEEDCFRRADGTIDWVAWEVRPWFDAEERIGGIIIMSENVTARKLALDALRDSEERWRSLVETLPDAMFVDDDGRIAYINQRGIDLWRAQSPQEIVGRSPSDLVAPDAVPDLVTRMARCSDDGAPVPTFETRARAMDGAIIPIESIARVRLENGRRVAQVVVRDISERKAAEARLRFQEGVLQDAGRLARVGGWTLDVASGEEFWTDEVARIYDCDAATPMTIATRIGLHAGEAREAFAASTDGALQHGIAYDLETELVTANGESRWLRSIGHPVLEQGRVVRLRGAVQDVTAQHEAAEQIRRLNEELEGRVRMRTAELEAANRELESFSYTVSHDLRAPLRTMDGFAEMLVEDYADLLPPDGVRRLRVIRERAQRMGGLIDDLLAFSRLGREPLRAAAVDMRALVDEALSDLLPACGARRIEVEVRELPGCLGDRGLLKQVWTNLISNALKYTRSRDTAHVTVGCERDARGGPVYAIRDDGTGFDMAHAGKLFGVFQRLHRSDEFEGTGVGLAIVQRIVQRHGGRVWCAARPDQGAAFFFTVAADGGA